MRLRRPTTQVRGVLLISIALWAYEMILIVLDFLKQTTSYLDALDWVEGYAWFACVGMYTE
jgi:hypothetical protein